MSYNLRKLFGTLALGLAALCAGTAHAGPYSNMFVFGDWGDRRGPRASYGFRGESPDWRIVRTDARRAGLRCREAGGSRPRAREVVAPALEQGHIDLVPEYLGTATECFGAPTDGMADLATALEAKGLEPLQPSPAQDVNVFVVTEETAGVHGLERISDLAEVASSFRFGGPVECPDRPLCLAGLQATYGLSFAEFVPNRTLAITAEALIREEIDVGVMFSTAAELRLRTSGARRRSWPATGREHRPRRAPGDPRSLSTESTRTLGVRTCSRPMSSRP